jgi:TusA-related sulfurtransferase
MQHRKQIDARGQNCPLPILRAKKALSDVQSGQVLKAEVNGEFTFFMRKK